MFEIACLVLAAKDQELSFSNPTLLPCASNSELFNVLELLPPGGSGLGVRQKSHLSSLRRELKWVLPHERGRLLERPSEPSGEAQSRRSGEGTWRLGICGSWWKFEATHAAP